MFTTRQQEKFIVLMQNYSQALEYATLSSESAGTATKKYNDYLDSIEGKMATLSATFEEFSMNVLNSEFITGVVDFLSTIVGLLNTIASLGDGILIIIPAITIALTALYAIVLQIKSTAMFATMLAGLKSVLAVFPALLAGFRSIIANLKLQAVGHKFTTASLVAQTQATQAATAAQNAFNATNPIGWIVLAATAIYGLVKALNALAEQQRKNVEEYEERADEQDELVEKYDSEIDALESLQKKLQAAHGNKTKLAAIYDELNEKVSVSTNILNGEEAAYIAVNLQLQDAIAAQQKLREEANKAAIAAKRSAFNERTMTRKGDILYNWLGLTSGALFMWDWAVSDASGEQMREAMRGTLSGTDISYDKFYNQMTTDQQNQWLRQQGMERDDWDEYWDNQITIAKEVFSDTINSANGYFTSEFMSSTVDLLTRGGYDLDEMSDILDELLGADSELDTLLSDYYTSLANKSSDSAAIYNQLQSKLNEIKNSYPILSSLIESSASSISTSIPNDVNGVTVALKSAYEILEDVQGGYDGLYKAMSSVTDEGYLTADALATLSKLEEEGALAGLELEKILIRDANGYKFAGNALQEYVQALIEQYTVTKAFYTLQDRENAIENLKTLQAVLATLAQTQEDATDADEAYREELEKQQDAYESQLDAYEELIDLRKDLLKTYEEELSYQKELAKRQRNVTQLQTKLSVARLDTSAAGQARVRELEAELKEAQEDLEDFTLEHAIDVLQHQLESQYAEYETFIKGKLDEITRLLDELDTTPEVNIITDTTWGKDAIAQIENLIVDTGNADVIDTSSGDTSSSGERLGTYAEWSAYWYAQNPGVYGPPSPMPEGWTVPNTTPKTYSTIQGYRDAIQGITDEMVADNKANGRSEAFYVSSQQWQARYCGAMSTDSIETAKSAYEWLRDYYISITGKTPSYHTGGFVGDFNNLASNEEFAKLLKGEFVSTPAQMKKFMEETLPAIASYQSSGGYNEFNAPLVEIICESVTSESIPELKRVVDEAVKEIKKQLDSGMSRTGYKRSVKTI